MRRTQMAQLVHRCTRWGAVVGKWRAKILQNSCQQDDTAVHLELTVEDGLACVEERVSPGRARYRWACQISCQ